MPRNNFSLSDLKNTACAKLNPHLFEEQGKRKRKYNNEPVIFNGINFDSKGELSRYLVLRAKEKAGQIKDLQHHFPVYELNHGGSHSLKYEPDFSYYENGELVIEDFKGSVTQLFKKKQRLMKEVYGIEVRVVGSKG